MVGAYILVSITIWIVARFSPREWREIELCDDCLLERFSYICDGQDECSTLHSNDGSSGFGSQAIQQEIVDDDDEHMHHHFENECILDVLQNDFTIGNSFWFAIGSLMQQGSDLNLKVF